MHLQKKLIQIAAVLGSAGWLYATAASSESSVTPAAATDSILSFSEKNNQTFESGSSEKTTESETTVSTESDSRESETAPSDKSETKTSFSPASEKTSETELLSESETAVSTENDSKKPETEPIEIPDTERELSTETETTSTDTERTSETEAASETEFLLENPSLPEKYLISSQYLLIPSFSDLRSDLEEMIQEYEGEWSIYLKDLKTQLSLTINDQPQDSASLIKLYIAGAVLEEVRDGELEMTETLEQLLHDMISLSDNEAANELVRYLGENHNHRSGVEKVNEFILSHNYTDTHQYNGLEDPALWYTDTANVTSATDCGRLLEEIYNGDFINHLSSRQMEGYLLDQDITWKIPYGIPSEVVTANKTGEKDNTQNDAAIVYTPYRDYILCVMGTDLKDEDSAIEHIRSISSVVYSFFTEADTLTEYTESAGELSVTEALSETENPEMEGEE
jgi:beta-lactamase class A